MGLAEQGNPSGTENVIVIQKPEGKYTVFKYPSELLKDPNRLPSNVGGVVVGTNGDNWAEAPSQYFFYKFLRNGRLGKLLPKLQQERIPLFLLEPGLIGGKLLPAVGGAVATSLEMAAGGALALAARDDIEYPSRSKRFTRRGFFLGLFNTVFVGWASSSFWSPALRVAWETVGRENTTGSSRQIGEMLTQRAVTLSSEFHPEQALTDGSMIRNAVVAYKAKELLLKYPNYLSNSNRHLVIVVENPENGLDRYIKATAQDNLEVLQRIESVARRIALPASFFQIARFGFNGEGWVKEATTETSVLAGILDPRFNRRMLFQRIFPRIGFSEPAFDQ